MKEIKLGQFGKNKGVYVALVDDEDFERLNSFSWYAQKGGNTFYAQRCIKVNGKKVNIRMHREILNGSIIDHIDRNGLNNQKSNLRVCTTSENAMNMRKHKKSKSNYKGVCFHKLEKKWVAQIKINRKGFYLGYFMSEVDAARAYNSKAVELFGEFANLNIID